MKRPPGSFENDRIAVESAIYTDRETVKKMIGHDFDGTVAVVEIKVTPRGGEALEGPSFLQAGAFAENPVGQRA